MQSKSCFFFLSSLTFLSLFLDSKKRSKYSFLIFILIRFKIKIESIPVYLESKTCRSFFYHPLLPDHQKKKNTILLYKDKCTEKKYTTRLPHFFVDLNNMSTWLKTSFYKRCSWFLKYIKADIYPLLPLSIEILPMQSHHFNKQVPRSCLKQINCLFYNIMSLEYTHSQKSLRMV